MLDADPEDGASEDGESDMEEGEDEMDMEEGE
jgi:hypothetical protein